MQWRMDLILLPATVPSDQLPTQRQGGGDLDKMRTRVPVATAKLLSGPNAMHESFASYVEM